MLAVPLLEPKIGGTYRIDINGSDIAMGEYLEIVPYERIIMSWGWDNSTIMPPGASKVEFLFTPQEDGTLLVLNHYNIPSEKVSSNNNGWTHYLDRLKLLTEGVNPGIDPWSKQI
ncbi:SRPBCC family protein [Bacillus sp. DJP31]|uniref:SRPBCC family protein n=1 Tax=Bacillus sp. DJP31 TaxID=3409789 RepID=UPI003BB814C0